MNPGYQTLIKLLAQQAVDELNAQNMTGDAMSSAQQAVVHNTCSQGAGATSLSPNLSDNAARPGRVAHETSPFNFGANK